MGRQTTLLVATKRKTHGWPNHAGSYYSSSGFDHAAKRRADVQPSSHATLARTRTGAGADLPTGHGGMREEGDEAAPGKQDSEGIKGSTRKWDGVCAAWHKGSEPRRRSRARAG